jgi:hypothetical protein
MQEGGWDLTGSAFGMNMSGTLTLDATGCAFTFSDWNMGMSVPAGGTVSGDQITLTGSGWESCVLTAASGIDASGVCSDNGASVNMVAQ